MKPVIQKGVSDLNFSETNFDEYLAGILHDWLKVLTVLAGTLVPIFFVLDFFIVPRVILPRVGIYRLISVVILLTQFIIIRKQKSTALLFYHGYLVSINVGAAIALMTVDLGGFNSSYYAGLNLVIIGVNLLLPWGTKHSALNCGFVIFMYVFLNLLNPQPYDTLTLTNNMFFLVATAIVTVAINHVRHKQIRNEFSLLVELKKARDALWSEVELAKRIQTALLPEQKRILGYEIAAAMHPAKDVGGDYYDIIETADGSRWVSMGDVSGHGVDSGLIMMMAQTSIMSMVNNCTLCQPSEVLDAVNGAMRENITRLGSDHYMTLMLIKLGEGQLTVAGKHQDLVVYRADQNKVEMIPTKGTWIGISDNLIKHLTDEVFPVNNNDVILLFSDGITEAANSKGEMFGQDRLAWLLNENADLPTSRLVTRIIDEVENYQVEQMDDITLVALRKIEEV